LFSPPGIGTSGTSFDQASGIFAGKSPFLEMTTTQPVPPEVSIIIPARNEEASLASCLESLLAQTDVVFEIIVVNDHSTDRTRAIASSFPNVKVMDAPSLPPCWTGKNNALIAGAAQARGEWLLFTDADTVHLSGSLARALKEAKACQAALLSYSPEQGVSGFWEKAVMPVIFAELAAHYRPSEVSNPNCPAAAANGQYILISREAYDAIGGHAAVADKILEDVELARAAKRSGRKILFRFGADAVRTRMYRNFSQLREGWTKNLAILFPAPAWLAVWRLSEFLALLFSLALLILFVASRQFLVAPLFLIGPVFTFRRIARAHFPWSANVLAFLGIPLFSYLLVRSKLAHQRGRVAWKGREYSERPQNLVPDHSPRIVRKLS
jgi:glycosyltransferase involved in cell wall biosynthesis